MTMKRPTQTDITRQAPAQDWAGLQPGDVVDVVEAGGYTYSAYIETKTEQSDIVWIRACGFGTRHLLHNLDGTRLVPPAEQRN
jgi:hypothetical protein